MTRPCVIAEIGFNHEGEVPRARELIRLAAQAGADAVKFQSFRAADLVLPDNELFPLFAQGELSEAAHRELAAEAAAHGVAFLSTPFGRWGVELLASIGVPAYKIASMDVTNRPLLAMVAATKKPVYLSTGMATLAEIEGSVEWLARHESGPVTLLHCVSTYPCPADQVNLAAIPALRVRFGLPVGYSDHHPGTAACIAAAALGATVIETHFTDDTARPGGDHGHSADPASLARLVETLKEWETMTGSADALAHRPDAGSAAGSRRGVYAARDLPAGTVLTEADLLFVRPVSAFSPNDLEQLVGATLVRPLEKHAPLIPADLARP